MAGGSGFGFESAGHLMAAAFHDLKKALSFVEQGGAKVMKAESAVEGITAVLPDGTSAVVLERAAFSALGLVLSAASAASAAAEQDGLNVSLDGATVAAFRALIAGCKSELALLGYRAVAGSGSLENSK